ncbi:MAG: hypothetical protein U5K74_00875 [Gemmatimonadaceae bacterium]|nr:hypothetical protein [Gemmatimonadaceae bacterium]
MRVPLEVRVALVGNVRPSPQAWDVLMQAAATRPRDAQRENFEERLLAMLASDSVPPRALPATFPAWRASATPLWRYLWAVNMLRAGRADAALPYTATPIAAGADSVLARDAAMLASRIHLTRLDWAAAAATPGIDEWTRRYIVRVLAPDTAVVRMRGLADRAVAREARLVLATAAARAGRWNDAASEVRDIDPRRAAQYTRLGTLARDTMTNAGLQRFAAALSAAGGQVFYANRPATSIAA